VFKWLTEVAERKIIQSHLSEMMPWVRQLSSLSDVDIGVIYFTALGYRNILLKTTGVDLFRTEHAIEKNKALALQIGAQIRDAQQSSLYSNANGLKVWLFTIRSVMHSELRPAGVAMWGQLTGGVPHVHTLSQEMYERSGFQSDLTDCGRVPVGFGPKMNR
jgi:hypothetical protein